MHWSPSIQMHTFFIPVLFFTLYFMATWTLIQFQLTGFPKRDVNNHTLTFPKAYLHKLVDSAIKNELTMENAYPINHSLHPSYHPKASYSYKLLCATFIACNSNGLKKFIENTKEMHQHCDWAIVCYSEDQGFSTTIQSVLAYQNITIVHCVFVKDRAQLIKNFTHSFFDYDSNLFFNHYNDKIYPKPLLYIQIAHLLSAYDYIWLLDDDISFYKFDFIHFRDMHLCAFYPSPPPLIVQPVVAENTQACKYLNMKTWNEYSRGSKALATESGFIEIQAPLIDTDFFKWYIHTLIMPILWSSHVLGADWGLDYLFCNSAIHYAITVLKWKKKYVNVRRPRFIKSLQNQVKYSSSQIFTLNHAWGTVYTDNSLKTMSEYPVCAIVLGDNPIHHKNSHTIDSMLDANSKRALNHALMSILANKFPQWFQAGCIPVSDPLSGSIDYKMVFEGDAEMLTCLAGRN